MKENYGIIYCLTNLINNKKYIGQTITKLEYRINGHFSCANNKNNKTPICRAIRKYGKENFEWVILDKAYTQEELDKKEIYWINYYNTYNHDGYNATLGGQKNKINFICKKEREQYTSKKYKHPFLVFDLQGNYIKEIVNMCAFADEISTGAGNVFAVLSGKKNSIHGYILFYKDEFTKKKLRERIRKTNNKTFRVFDLNKNYIGSWNSQIECAKELNIHRGNISKCLIGDRLRINGYYFYYEDDCPQELLIKIPN